MEFFFPLSMLGVGLVIGALAVWFVSRSKTSSEFATLVERLAGKEDQVRQLREALDRETAHTEELRNENSRTAAQLSALQAKLEEERKRSEEHTSELQSRLHLVCRLLLEKKKKK